MPNPPRSFRIGETVHLSARVSIPGTRKPVDPATVTLSALSRDGLPVSPSVSTFTRRAQGDYTLSLPTTGMQAGTYDLVVTVADGPTAVVVIPDRFVLRAA